MDLIELCAWLRANSSGVYRPSAEAACAIERLSMALFNVMDGVKPHEIQEETGLPPSECDQIESVRNEAVPLAMKLLGLDQRPVDR